VYFASSMKSANLKLDFWDVWPTASK